MKTVIAALEGSMRAGHALEVARRLADAAGATVVIAAPAGDPGGGAVPSFPPAPGEQVAHCPPACVIDLAEAASEPVIVAASDVAAGGAETVVRSAPCPTVLIGPKCLEPEALAGRTGLLVCTDGSTRSEAVVPAATTVARALGLQATVFQVSPSGVLVAPLGRPRDSEHADRLARSIAQVGVLATSRTIRDPDPAAAILELAAEVRPAFIALTTHGRTGLARVLLGSVAAEVVTGADCPVLLVRPGNRGRPEATVDLRTEQDAHDRRLVSPRQKLPRGL